MWKRVKKLWFMVLGVLALPVVTLIALGRYVWEHRRTWWGKTSKWIVASIAVLLSAVVILAVVELAVDYYRDNYTVYLRYTERISRNVEVHHFNRGIKKVFNTQTDRYTLDQIYWMSNPPEGDSLAVFSDIYRFDPASKRGYINIMTGEVVIPATEYSRAWHFSDDVAAVVKDGKVGFIDRQNNVVIPFKFDYDPATEDIYDFGYMFYDGYSIMTTAEGLFGIINKDGEWVVEPQYDQITGCDIYGWREVYNNGMVGLMATDGRIVYEPEYDYIMVTGFDAIVLAKEGLKWQEDSAGNVVKPLLYDYCKNLSYYVYDAESEDYKELLSPYLLYTIDEKEGIMHKNTGEILSPAVYENVSIVGTDRFQIYDTDTGYYYQITADELRKLW